MPSNILDLLTLHEGYRQFIYEDTVGKRTIGIGFNLDDVGLSLEEAKAVLAIRVANTEKEVLAALPWVRWIDPVRRAVIIDMAYNMGMPTLLTFKRTLSSVQYGHYELAAQQMLESKWARQVKKRAVRLSNMMKTGEWPKE